MSRKDGFYHIYRLPDGSMNLCLGSTVICHGTDYNRLYRMRLALNASFHPDDSQVLSAPIV